MIPLVDPTNNFEKPFEYFPPARFKKGDKVVILSPPVRWGFPLDLKQDHVLTVIKESFSTKIGWTASVKYNKDTYEIWEDDLQHEA